MLSSLLTDAEKKLRDFLIKAELKQPSQPNENVPLFLVVKTESRVVV